MSTNFGSKDGILIRIMTVDDYKLVKIFMREHFFIGNPMNDACDEDVQKCNEKENDEYHIDMIKQNTSLLAVKDNDEEQIVGFVLAGAQVPSDLEKSRKEADELEENAWKRIAVFNSLIEREANVFKHYGVSEVLYSHITTVHTSMRGKGLGARLAKALMELGRSKGFPAMAASCSSYYSARQKQALGMECIYSHAYDDYKDINGNVVFKTEAPNTHVRFLAMRL
ncbi:arylalkylamine N-acetyltransferase-like 2 [Drosophila albomicans]|uniref:aralkylamine N-acetyltransferase n=1 Tax=Drosophila albomicans TaxID=7291 RepID=A0A6P8WFY0_DROAB|nr:arylalkylamine N-acetyltransferase-like 2 [Drosophila albomicans]